MNQFELLDSLIEQFNCGIGPDGFENGNTCAKGGSGHQESESREKNETLNKWDDLLSKKGIKSFRNGHSGLVAEMGEVETDGTVAGFVIGKNAVFFNEKHSFFDDPKSYQKDMYSKGWMSTGHEDHVVYHELAHALHYKNLGEIEFMEMYKKATFSFKAPQVFETAKSEVSLYASTHAFELIAEMYCGMLLDGKRYSKQLMNIYEDFGGPSDGIEHVFTENHAYEFLDSLIEMFDRGEENCGIGSAGFEKNNKCAVSKGGIKSQADARKAVKSAEKSLKSPAKPSADQSAAKPSKTAPYPSGKSVSSAKPTKKTQMSSKPISGLAKNEKIKAHADSIMKGNIPPKQAELSERAAKALDYHKPVTGEMKEIAKQREQDVAAGLGGQWLSDHEPVDVVIWENDKEKFGIECKTTFDNTRGAITIDPAANFNKVNWSKDRKKTRIDIVVCDDKTGDMFYKRGVGSFSINAMYKVPGGYKNGMEELKKLVHMKEKDKNFPEAAKYQDTTTYHAALHDTAAYKALQEQALESFLAKEARRSKSKEKMKGNK